MAAAINQRMSASLWAMLILLSTVWGCSFLFIEVLLRELPPFTIVLARVGIASVLMYLLLRLSGGNMPRGARVWRALFVIAALNSAIPYALFTYGQMEIDSGLASILNATTPLWGVVMTHLFTADEKANPGKIVGVILGIVGVIMMVGSDALAGLGSSVLAQLACLGATLCYAIASVYARRFKPMGLTAWQVATGQLLCAAVLILPFSLLFDKPWALPGLSGLTLLALGGFVLLSTVLAYFLFFRLLESAGAMNAILTTFLIPIPAVILGAVFLGEQLEPKHYLGMATIGLGLLAIDGRLYARLRAGKLDSA